jgi:hypothetical protein
VRVRIQHEPPLGEGLKPSGLIEVFSIRSLHPFYKFTIRDFRPGLIPARHPRLSRTASPAQASSQPAALTSAMLLSMPRRVSAVGP